jgi:hypothetical protein
MLDDRSGFLDTIDVMAYARFAEDEKRRAVFAGERCGVDTIYVKAAVLASEKVFDLPGLGHINRLERQASLLAWVE